MAKRKSTPAKPASNLKSYPLTTEAYREYDYGGRVYRINNPVTLFIRPGGETHRVLDSEGVVHCVLSPSIAANGCVLRWKNKDPKNPCEF